MQGTRTHMSACCTPLANPTTACVKPAESSGVQPVLASVARAERRAALVAAGGVATARACRGRRGGRSQQVQLVRIDRVDNFVQNLYDPTSKSRSRSRCRTTLPSVPLVLPRARPRARPFNVTTRSAGGATRSPSGTPLTPPSSPPPLPAQDLPWPAPPPVLLQQRRKG